MTHRLLSCAVATVFLAVAVASAKLQTLAEIQQRAESGDAAAQFRLGSMYGSGVGVERNYAKAFDWLSKSADQGNTEAMSLLALMWGAGAGTKQDMSQAYMWAALADRLAPEAKKAEYAKSKREMASWLSPAQIAAVDIRVDEWLKAHHLPK